MGTVKNNVLAEKGTPVVALEAGALNIEWQGEKELVEGHSALKSFFNLVFSSCRTI